MSRYRRWNELLELLAADGQLQMERAVQALGMSAATARREFAERARQQLLMAGRADRVVVTADSSQVGRRAFARICAAAEVGTLVTDTDTDTDTGIAPAAAAKLADAGVKFATA